MPSARRQMIDEMILENPHLPRALIRMWVDRMIEHGDEELAWAEVRASDEYQTEWFPAMVRDDGSLRYADEQEYYQVYEGYKQAIEGVGVNSGQLHEDIIESMQGDKSFVEFRSQLQSLQERVLLQEGPIRQWYRDNYGIEPTRAGIIAGIMSPRVGQALLDRQITMAEIAGESIVRGLELSFDLIEDLAQSGMDRAGAQRFAGAAASAIPVFNVLARRHADPDDDFDIEEFSAASVFDDPFQLRRMQRLVQQERMAFAESGGFGLQRSTTGGLMGLEA